MKNCSLVKCGFSCHVRLAVGWDQCLWQFMGVIFLTVCPVLSCIVANKQKEVRKRCIGPNNPVDLNRHCSWWHDLVSVWFNNIVLKLFLLKWLEFYLKTWYISIIPLQCFLNHPFFSIPTANTQIYILVPYAWFIKIFFSLASISLFLPPFTHSIYCYYINLYIIPFFLYSTFMLTHPWIAAEFSRISTQMEDRRGLEDPGRKEFISPPQILSCSFKMQVNFSFLTTLLSVFVLM